MFPWEVTSYLTLKSLIMPNDFVFEVFLSPNIVHKQLYIRSYMPINMHKYVSFV